MSSVDTRSVLLAVVMFVALVAMGATAAAAAPTDASTVTADDVVGPDQTANETTIDVAFIGTVVDDRTVTAEATGIMNGSDPVDGVDATVTVGGEVATTATVTNGDLVAEFDPSALNLEPTDSAEVDLVEYNVTDPATVEVVHEAFDLNASTRLRSVPQGAEFAAEDVAAVNVWDAADGTYDAVTSPVFETAANLHQGLYITGTGENARVGYTFDTTTSDPGTVNLSSGWNYASSNFDISSTANQTVAEDLNLVSGNVSELEVFTADFSQQLDPTDTVGAYDSYWVFVEEGDQPVERNITDPAYNRSAREDVLGVGEVTFNEQALGTDSDGNPAVLAEGVKASAGDAVAVTYTNGTEEIVAGLTVLQESVDGESVPVAIEDGGGFPGEHTAHVITDLSDATAIGEPVSEATANSIAAQDSAVVYSAGVLVDNQTYEDGTLAVDINASAVAPDEEYVIVVHNATEGLPVLGNSGPLNGTQQGVTIDVDEALTSTTDIVAMLHFAAEDEPFGAPITTLAGEALAPVTDTAQVGIFSAEGAELSFDEQAVGINDQGNPVVYVDNITEAEQVEQDLVSDPADDFVVIYEGDTFSQDAILDFRNIGDARNGELVLDAENATPGEHTVELFADTRSSFDPTTDVDADHPMLEVITGDGDTASGPDEYVVALEEDLTVPAGMDRQAVTQQLKQQAAAAQEPVVDAIERMDGATVQQEYWVTNAVLVSAEDVSPAELERIDGVEHVAENIEAEHPSPASGDAGEVAVDDVTANQVTYGLDAIDVPGFEETYNTQGEGTRVAIIDDGLNVSHPDIDLELGVQVENGQIINEPPTISPGSQHGQHVAGTAVGTADPAGDVPRYSVAPGADLLKADIWVGGPTLGDTIAAVQWSVSENADVTSMSLGFGQGLGESTVVPLMADTMRNAQDAGTLVIGSAGNEGSGIAGGPVTSPGAEFNGFSVGASAEGGAVAGFSSGTVVTPNDVLLFPTGAAYPEYFPREYIKPDVTAPGVQVLSAGPLGSVVAENPAYSVSSGTSMAAPHVAGAAALVQAATDEQLDPRTIKNALAETAEKPTTQLGGQNERDIRYGTGIINVTAATMAVQNTTTISGTITDSATGEPVAGAQVTTDTGATTATDENGTYSITVTNNSASTVVTVEAFGFTNEAETVPLDDGDQTVDFALDPEVDVVPVTGQPAFAEFQDSFNITVDVRNLEEYAVELTDATGVAPGDISVTVAGETLSPGENISFDPAASVDGVPVTVAIDGTFEEGDQFALAHSFAGPGEDIEVTTGPTQLTETQAPAQFALSEFTAPPGQDLGGPEPYAASVTVTNVGQTPGEAELRWFLGPLGLAGSNPVVELDPGESTEEVLDFGEIDIGSFFGGEPVNLLQGFDAVPTAPDASGDLAFEEFTVGDGAIPVFDPIDPLRQRGVAETSPVYAADVSIDDQTYEQSTGELTVATSSVAPTDQEYVVVLHAASDGSVLGSSGDLTGPQENVTISLDEPLENTTGVVAMVHFAADGEPFGEPITAYDPVADGLAPVTDTATVDVLQLVFEVGPLDAPDTVTQGDLFDVSANVTAVDFPGENTNLTETQTVQWRFDGEVQRSRAVTLNTDETTTVTFENISSEIPRGSYTHSIASQTDSSSATIDIQEPVYFEVTAFEAPSTIVQEDTVTVSATVNNTVPPSFDPVGSEATDTQTIEYRVGTRTLASKSITLEANANQTVTFQNVTVPKSVTAGEERVHGIYSADDNETAPVTVLPTDAFLVENLVPEDAEVTQGDDPIDVSVDVENLGGTSGAQDIVLEVFDENDTVVYSDTIANLTLGPGENTTETFENVPAGNLSVGSYTHVVSSDEDDVDGSLDVLEFRSLAFGDQALGVDTDGNPAVLVEDVDAVAGEAVAVTYDNGTDVVVAGLTLLEENVSDGTVPVAIEDAGGFPGEHTAHVVTEPSNETAVGQPVSAASAASIAAQQTATVFDAAVNITDQTFEDGTTELVVDTSDLQPDGEYRILLQQDTIEGPVLGSSGNLTGPQDNVTITVEGITTETDVAATLRDPADSAFPPAIPALDGDEFGMVTDKATVEILSAEGASLSFDDQATGSSTFTDGTTDSGVVIQDIEPAELVAQNVSDPSEDFVVLFEGSQVDADSIVAFEPISAADNGTLVFNLTDANVTPGQYTAEIHADDGTGQPDPAKPRGAAETATVLQGTVDFADRTISSPIEEGDTLVTLQTADLLDGIDNDTAFTVDVHPTDDNGTLVGTEFVGSSDVLTGANDNVTVTAEAVPANGSFNQFPIDATDSYVAMVHVVDDNASAGDPASPGTYPVLPNADAATGFVPGGVTDQGQILFPTGEINGTVTNNATGTPIEGATIEVFAFGPDGSLAANDTTDANGEYSVGPLPVGEHFVTVSVDGSVADERNVTVLSNQTTTADFPLDESTFTVDILNNLTGAAGETQTAEIAVENTGDLPGTQTIDLDWGDGAYTNATSVELAGGADTVVSLSITTATNQALGFYNVTATSDDDTAETTATLGPQRSLNQTMVAPGGAVEVTVSGQVGAAGNVTFADEWAPPANSSEILSTSFPTAGAQGEFADSVFLQSDGDVSSGPIEIVYEISVSTDAADTLYEWEPFVDGDGSVLQLGDANLGIFGDQSFEVEPTVDNILLDSVSSLLNESGQPFTSQQQAQPLIDNSLVALAAEPSASNEDSDGNGDAVIYPNDTEIPVVAVDGGVVGVSGPFVTTDTDFANYGNEEFMLNLYDELLGGSGTILHDEGHGQFYTLAPNGGDDFQAFADYAENNGYTYDNTTDIQNATGAADAFVITSPSEAFSQSELDALSTFVANGGVLFLHDQSDFNNFDATDNHNAIASAVNASFRFNDDQVVDDQNNTGARFVPVTGNFNLDEYGPVFTEREGLGFELDVNETYQVDVTSVTDGDTASVEFSDGTVESVRIVGIDTPETGNTDERLEEYEGIDNATALKNKADGATAYAENLLANETVNLTFSPTEGLRGDFGRLLGFLELDDGSVFNEEIVRDGWARVYDSGFAQHDDYWDLEQQARANNSGIWEISDSAATSEIRDDPVSELFFPQPVEVTGPETPVRSENGEPLVALDRDANVAAFGGPLIEERFETGEGGPGIGQYEVFPFTTNVMAAVGNATGPVVVDAGHNQFGVDYAVSAEDTAYYMRYLEGQSPGEESFIGLDGTVDLASDAGPDLVEGGSPAARAVVISTPSSELSPAERTTVAEFADAGGAVILLGTAANASALSNFDSLLSALNTSVGFTGTNVTDSTNNLGGDSTIPTTSNFSDSQFPELFTEFTPPQSAAPFNVSSLVPADATVTEGDEFDVSATVTNEGTESDEQTVELRLEPEGTAVRSQTVQLNASESTTVTFSNVSVGQAGEYNHTVASLTDQVTGSLTVEAAFADVFLDSVSSLLNASQQPLTDDSITAIEAESTASNTDADGNGDAVSYPSDTDIPVAAVDGNVVGITGPFVTSDTDFANYSNEEFMLNVYDRLLGGSGTVLHDEGHGQFYTLAPNGGDDFQTFAGFAESEGYTYDNTTDIQNATDVADAFVITTPSEAFSQSELDALSTFVDEGGVVILHDQSDFNDFDATDNHNEIASAVNASFRFNDDQVVDDTNNAGQSFLPVTGNFNEAEFPALFSGASFNVSNLAPTDATVSQGEAFDVSATVTNEGTVADDQPVELRLEPDGTAVRSQTVQLGVGESTTVTFSNVTVDQVGEYNHTVATPGDRESGSLTVDLADVFLDSVSSLLNASQQPLIDDSITAIEAESTASNTDADGDGDAVSYPSDVDIPVAAVDGGVVGVTGPFVPSDTDFANYSNEEIMLNVYDELLGGSGTILHDEGHGQFYTLAPNGGDDFQAFADYAESNGYTYDNTTDIQNATGTADAFVITTPADAFSQSELDALSTFVANGGVLFLHDQSDFNNFDATDNHNEIASAVNASFRFNDDQVVDDTNNAGQSFLPVTGNFNEAGFPALFSDRSDGGLTATASQQVATPVLQA